ncbi:MAG TPA: metal-dependent transcriptional regulator [Anaerolineales bacterium]|nr:metal-dependent transcriptional regulator [Anaerolineales bacterium]
MNWILAAFLLLIILLLPKYGLLALYRDWQSARQRELVEDALKHLLDREQQGRHASPESLAGTLSLPRLKTTRLIADMESQNLLETRGAEIHLTVEGERWAMHIVRAHRLWERYLADEARMPLSQIHTVAHRREHSFTDAQLDELSAALGHPTRDPHGDPIPTRDGKMPIVEITSVTAWQNDAPARIVHIEDEPAIAYDQILATGLRLGQIIRVIERTSQRVVLSDGETEYRLAPTVAANVGVAPLAEAESAKANAIPLAKLTQDQRAEILSLDSAVQGFTRRRFLDLGLTPGTIIYPELGNFFGEPRAYRVRGTLIALRKDQATQIWVKPV